MPIPPPPPPPGPLPPPTFSQAKTTPPKLNRDEAKGRGALLSDICKGARLKKVTVVSDRSAPVLEKSGGGGGGGGGSGGGFGGSSGPMPMGGLFSSGVPKLRPVGESTAGRSALRPPGSRPALPRTPSHQADEERSLPTEQPWNSQPDNSKMLSSSNLIKSNNSAPPPPPPFNRRGNNTPATSQQLPMRSVGREKPFLPPHANKAPPPLSAARDARDGLSKISPSPRPSPASNSALPPPPPYRGPPPVTNGDPPPELPQRRNSLNRRINGNARTQAPPPPPPPQSQVQQCSRPPPPARDPPGRRQGDAPQGLPSASRNGFRDTPPPPPPPSRVHSAVTVNSEPPSRGRPPPPNSSNRQPLAYPHQPPPPPLRNEHTSRAFVDDFESKYYFHPVEDLPPPEEYRKFTKIYPSKTNRAVMRGVPPLPPVGK